MEFEDKMLFESIKGLARKRTRKKGREPDPEYRKEDGDVIGGMWYPNTWQGKQAAAIARQRMKECAK